MVNSQLLKLLKESQNQAITSSHLPFPIFMKKLEAVSHTPATNMVELRQKNNKKLIGDIFEDFCYLYFLKVKKVEQAWTNKTIPDYLKTKLALPKNDMGIDLVIQEGQKYSAVQVKYRKRSKTTNVLSWKELSTFYASCLRSGPWKKHIVFTNCDYLRRTGRKTEKDLSICFGTLRNLTSFDFLEMITELEKNSPSSKNLIGETTRNDQTLLFENNKSTESLETESLETESLETESLETESLETESLENESLGNETLETESLEKTSLGTNFSKKYDQFKPETLAKAQKFLENRKKKQIEAEKKAEEEWQLLEKESIENEFNEEEFLNQELLKVNKSKSKKSKNQINLEELRIRRLIYFNALK